MSIYSVVAGCATNDTSLEVLDLARYELMLACAYVVLVVVTAVHMLRSKSTHGHEYVGSQDDQHPGHDHCSTVAAHALLLVTHTSRLAVFSTLYSRVKSPNLLFQSREVLVMLGIPWVLSYAALSFFIFNAYQFSKINSIPLVWRIITTTNTLNVSAVLALLLSYSWHEYGAVMARVPSLATVIVLAIMSVSCGAGLTICTRFCCCGCYCCVFSVAFIRGVLICFDRN